MDAPAGWRKISEHTEIKESMENDDEIEAENSMKVNGKTVFLKIVKNGPRSRLSIVACDRKGEEVVSGYLVTFNKNGTIYLEPAVTPGLPFKLNEKGQIELSDSCI